MSDASEKVWHRLRTAAIDLRALPRVRIHVKLDYNGVFGFGTLLPVVEDDRQLGIIFECV